jgi:hypothetical protein
MSTLSVAPSSEQVRGALFEDLAAYLDSRRLRIVRRYFDACQNKGLWLPMLRQLYAPSARRHVNTVESCVERAFSRHSSEAHTPPLVAALILSYLPLAAFSPFPLSTKMWVEGVRDVLGRSPFAAAIASPMGAPGGPTPSRLLATPGSTKRPREEDFESPPLGRGPLSEPSSSTLPPLDLATLLATPDKRTRTPPPLSPGTALTSATMADQAHFYLRPPHHDVTHVFARMLTSSMLNDEEMNRYFGRFGQVACKRVRCEAVTLLERGGWSFDAHQQIPGSAALSTGRSMSRRGASSLWMQDFVVEVDLPANATSALVELRDPAILFIAPSHPERNLYTSADLDESLAASHDDVAVVHTDAVPGVVNDDDAYVPDLVVDRVPYWYAPDQFSFICAAFGDVASVRYSIDDKSGAFTGAVLLTMATSEGARKAAHGLHGKVIEQDQPPLVCGVLNSNFQLESLLDPAVVLLECKYAEPLLRVLRCGDGTSRDANTFVNPRLWL